MESTNDVEIYPVSRGCIGRIYGFRGKTLKQIVEKTNCLITQIENSDNLPHVFYLQGSREERIAAKRIISDIVDNHLERMRCDVDYCRINVILKQVTSSNRFIDYFAI